MKQEPKGILLTPVSERTIVPSVMISSCNNTEKLEAVNRLLLVFHDTKENHEQTVTQVTERTVQIDTLSHPAIADSVKRNLPRNGGHLRGSTLSEFPYHIKSMVGVSSTYPLRSISHTSQER